MFAEIFLGAGVVKGSNLLRFTLGVRGALKYSSFRKKAA